MTKKQPIQAKSKSEYRRLKIQGADVEPPESKIGDHHDHYCECGWELVPNEECKNPDCTRYNFKKCDCIRHRHLAGTCTNCGRYNG